MDLALWEPASILKERFLVTSSGKQEEVIRSFREIEIMEMLYGLHQGGGVSIHYVILSRQWVCDVNIIPKYIETEGWRGDGFAQDHLPTCVSAF